MSIVFSHVHPHTCMFAFWWIFWFAFFGGFLLNIQINFLPSILFLWTSFSFDRWIVTLWSFFTNTVISRLRWTISTTGITTSSTTNRWTTVMIPITKLKQEQASTVDHIQRHPLPLDRDVDNQPVAHHYCNDEVTPHDRPDGRVFLYIHCTSHFRIYKNC